MTTRNGHFAWRRLQRSLTTVVLALLLPAVASAQSAVSGVVRDGSGGVLPGVAVSAASPALIEGSRSAITDSQGRYSIVDLRPGVYKITFELAGFSTLLRDAIELPSNVTVPIDVDLRLGALEETVTVSGGTPLVDVANVQRTQVLTRDIIDSLPITRNSHSIGAVVPGVKMSRPDVGGSQMMEQVAQSTHGSLNKDITMQIDGMMVNSSMADYGIQAYNDDALNQEVVVQTSAVPVEVASGGVRINMIPKDGGNRMSGALYLGGTPGRWQSSNIDDALRAKGIRQPNGVEHIQDFNGSLGGPILSNKLWYFASARHISVNEKVTNAFYPDGSPAIVDQYVRSGLARLTYQLAQNHKISGFFNRIWKLKGHELNTGTDVVKASWRRIPKHSLYYVGQAKWTATLGSNYLLESGFSTNIERLTQFYQPGIRQDRGTAAWLAGAAKQDAVLTTLNNAALYERGFIPDMRMVSVMLSRVGGRHSLKAGMQWAFGPVGDEYTANADLVQIYRSGVPDSVNVYNTPTRFFTSVDVNRGLFIQDSIRFDRFTVNAGLRFDQLRTTISDTELGASRFLPARSFSQDDVVDSAGNKMDAVPDFKNLSPRVSVSYDVFGNARTALKASYNQYVTAWAGGFANRYNPMTFASDQRRWIDANGDDIAQDSEIGPSQNANFGVRQSRFPNPDLSREYNVEYTASVQHEVIPGRLGAGRLVPPHLQEQREDDQRAAHAGRLPGVPGRQPARRHADHHLQPEPGQAGAGAPGRYELRGEPPHLRRLRSQLQRPPAAWHHVLRRLVVRPHRAGVVRHQRSEPAALLRRARLRHPVPLRLQAVGRHSAAVGPAGERHLHELRRQHQQRHPGGRHRHLPAQQLGGAGVGVPERPAHAVGHRQPHPAGHAGTRSGGTSWTSRAVAPSRWAARRWWRRWPSTT